MSERLSTAGIKVGYAVEATAGTRPTTSSSYTYLKEIKEIPEFNPEPSQLDTTTLDETEFRTYIPGLKDLGSTLGLTANFTTEFKTMWEAFVTASETAKADGKATWLTIVIPNFTEAFYVQCIPTPLGFSGASVDEVLEITGYVTPTSAPVWAALPTA